MGWLIFLGSLTLLSILPLGASIRYDIAGLVVKLIIGPVKLQILPAKGDKPQKEKKKKPPTEEKKTAPVASKPKEKGGSLQDFLPLVKVGLDFLNGFRRKLRINRLDVKLILAADDPCDLAVNYGRAWAAVGSLWPQLERCFVIKKRDVEVECDFTTTETTVIARADLTITLGRILGLMGYHGIRALKEFLKIKNMNKGGAAK